MYVPPHVCMLMLVSLAPFGVTFLRTKHATTRALGKASVRVQTSAVEVLARAQWPHHPAQFKACMRTLWFSRIGILET